MHYLGYANEPIRPSDWSRAIFNDMYCSLIGYCPDERPLLLKYPISGFSKTNSLALKPSCGESFFVLNTSLLEVVGH